MYSDWCCVCVVVVNIILIFIGVVKVFGLVIFEFVGKFDGYVLCVLVIMGLIIDLIFIMVVMVIVDEINVVYKKVVEGLFKGILKYIEDEIVFFDI